MPQPTERGAPARTLVVPMMDEATRLGQSLRSISRSALHDPDTELLLVDDGSTDGTAEVAERLVDELGLHGRVLRLPRNLGKGAAVAAGVAEARGRAIAFVDADLSTPPDAVLTCFELVEAGKADLVVTTRVHEEAVIARLPPLGRRYSGKAFNTLLRVLGLTEMSDTQCGLKAFTAEVAPLLFTDLAVPRFAFDVEVLLRARSAGLDVLEQPVEWRHVEASRVRPVRDGARMAVDAVRLRVAIGRRPARVTGFAAASAGMDRTRFEVMGGLEREHWWFAAKRRLVLEALDDAGSRRSGPAADVGCGTGAMVDDLAAAGWHPVVGTDVSLDALAVAVGADDRAPGRRRHLLAAGASTLPFPDATFACLTSLDVVEHLDDDVAALREYARVVVPGGRVVLTVPAYTWAWSDHDVALGHRRRYRADQLAAAAAAAGLTVERVTYFHSWLVPLAVLLRRTPLRRLVRGTAEEVGASRPAVNRGLGAVTAVERRILRSGRMPFGLSILLVGRTPDGS